MVVTDIEIGPMTADEVATTIDWAAAEGWNPGLADAGCFRSADPDGFLAARLAGRLVGSISLVGYGSGFGFLGLYIVVPELRGRGIGTQLWSAAMDRQGDRIVGLDGVVAMQDSYARSGFRLAHRNVRYGGPPVELVTAMPDSVSVLGADDLEIVSAYDEPCFGGPRGSFLAAWLAQPHALTVGVRAGAGLAGYGTARPCRDGWKVGPLFADEPELARALLARLLRHVRAAGGSAVFWDVPQTQTEAVELAGELALEPRFETARMYAGGDPDLPLDRVFGITSFELG